MKRLIIFGITLVIMTQVNLYGFVKIDEKGSHKIFGVAQIVYNYDFKTNDNAFNFGKTSLGIDGIIYPYIGYRFIVVLDPRDFIYKAFDVYGRLRFTLGEFRIGQFKPPFSMERLISFPKRDFVQNAIATGIVSSRDMGIGFFGNYSLFEFNFAVVQGVGLNKKEDNHFKDIIIRFVPKYKTVRFGGAVYIGKSGPDSLLQKRNLYNIQAELKSGLRHLRSEYVVFQIGDIEGFDYYIQGGYGFKINKPYLEEIEPVLRYEVYDPDRAQNGDSKKRLTGGINLYIKGYNLRVQINYLREIKEIGGASDKVYIAGQFMF